MIWGCAIAFNLFLSGNITFGFFALIALCPRIGLAFDLIPSECPKRDFIKWKFLKTRWILHMIVFPLVTIAYFIFPSILKFPAAICLLAVGQFIADFYIYLNLHRAL